MIISLAFLIVFIVATSHATQKTWRLKGLLSLAILGLSLEAAAFAIVNWLLSFGKQTEGTGFADFFAKAGAIAAFFLFCAFAASMKNCGLFPFARKVAIASGIFIVVMTILTWGISYFPELNWR